MKNSLQIPNCLSTLSKGCSNFNFQKCKNLKQQPSGRTADKSREAQQHLFQANRLERWAKDRKVHGSSLAGVVDEIGGGVVELSLAG